MVNGAIGDPEVERAVGTIPADSLIGTRVGERVDPALLLRRFYKFAVAADVRGRTPQQLAGAASSMAELAECRPATEARVRVFNPTLEDDGWTCDHTVVHVVVDNMPFLVDSVSGALNTSKHGIQSIIHPIMVVHRDTDGWLAELLDVERARDALVVGAIEESWLQFEIEKETNTADIAQIAHLVEKVLTDVRCAVEDWGRMRLQVRAIADELGVVRPQTVSVEECDQAAELLRWLVDDHFTFLGYREYDLFGEGVGEGAGEQVGEGPGEGTGERTGEREVALVSRPATGLGILRSERPRSKSFGRLSAEVRRRAREPKLLIITKANRKSTVHRSTYLDYIGIKRFDTSGRVVGERRLVGLFTTSAYSTSVMSIPVLHQIASRVIELSGFPPDSHSEKDLMRFIETYPRDELFQLDAEELWMIARQVLALGERRQTRLFLRRDEYGRFVSALVYLPRDKYDTVMRERIGNLLRDAYQAKSLDFSPMVSESVLTRLHYIVRMPPGVPVPVVDEERLIREIKDATVTWDDRMRAELVDRLGEERGLELWRRYQDAISGSYREQVRPAEAVIDLQRLAELAEWGQTRIELRQISSDHRFLFALYVLGEPVALSDLLPIFGSFGVEIETERSFQLGRQDGIDARIYHVELRLPLAPGARSGTSPAKGAEVGMHLEQRFAEAFDMTWRRLCDRDSLNRLVAVAGLSWREIAWIRSWVRYAQQIGGQYSPEYMASALVDNPHIARLLADLFRVRLDPSLVDEGRGQVSDRVDAETLEAIDGVESLGYDRILRRLRAIVLATLRTNAFAVDLTSRTRALALKFDPGRIPGMPHPVPKFEVWVWSPRVAGVHLRFGRISRGGLRWSDRSEDFRTEVLGLAKAQEIKNAVIVPDGAKGGFVVRDEGRAGAPTVPAARGVESYREFVSALLDVTDNRIRGAVVHPDRTVRWDGDDSYLVVAADKGTSSFSDIANEVAGDHGYWLGDAFASGGSVGYDHKAMGITARGAWVAVERHFRELDVDVTVDPIRVVGIGDMSGDVFGNAMLLSESMRLIAAFDHRHVFVDPDPDPAPSFAERRRLFESPGSSWADYDPDLISAGGAVYLRGAKSVQLSEAARIALDVGDRGEMTPDELIRAILRAPVDLLFNGGVGTFVKAAAESDLDVGDKANDAIRIDADALRVRVIGEGGNLGLTQAGRIDAALAGVALNTDSIDNSAGVDTSDHEVNIKIALDALVADDQMTGAERDALLARMQPEVARLVLRDNYLQNMMLGNARTQSAALFRVHCRLMTDLEGRGILDRREAMLPDRAECERRAAGGRGLTSPELSVLLALVKIALAEDILDSPLPREEYFGKNLRDYFPAELVERVGGRLGDHPLADEIIATQVANEIVNFAGLSFVFRVWEETRASPVEVARAFTVVREVFGFPAIWQRICELDGLVPTRVQSELQMAFRRLLDRATRWMVNIRGTTVDVAREVENLGRVVDELTPEVEGMLGGSDKAQMEEQAEQLVADGAPADLAREAASCLDRFCLLDIGEISRRENVKLRLAAAVYFRVSAMFDIADLLQQVASLPRSGEWDNLARVAMRSDVYAVVSQLAIRVLRASDSPDARVRVDAWSQRNLEGHRRVRDTLDRIREAGRYDLSTLAVALRMMRTLVAQDAGSGDRR